MIHPSVALAIGSNDSPSQIDAICDAFEASWVAGRRSRAEDYLDQVLEEHRPALLKELLFLECAYRFGIHGTIPPGAFSERFPEQATLVREVVGGADGLETAEFLETSPSYESSLVPLPEMIGKYRVIGLLGSGGQATVFRAINPRIANRDVVIKWAHAKLPKGARRQLYEEGRALAALDDPGVVRIYDVDKFEERPFVVFEHVAGHSLRDAHQRRPLSFREATNVVCELASTLERVHRKGILHRDLKPANVLIDLQGRPRLLDFGQCWANRAWDEEAAVPDGACGTPAYMSPEQAQGRGERVGVRTDIFGLGTILYELLTGQPPYLKSGNSTLKEMLARAREGAIIPPRQVNDAVPRALERICMQALDPDPRRRFASADAMAKALRRYLSRSQWVATAAIATTVVAGVAAFVTICY